MERRTKQFLLVGAAILFVVFIVFSGSAERAISGVASPKIDLTKWKLHLDEAPVQSGTPAYFPLNDDAASSAVIEIATEARAPKDVAYVALVKHKQDPPTAFVGGIVDAPAGSLMSVVIELSNSDQKAATFSVGDLTLVSPNGRKLRFVGLSKGDSPLIVKFSDNAEKGSEAVPVMVDAGKTVRLNYCFVVTPESFPLRLQFGNAMTDIVLKGFPALKQNTSQGDGFSMSLGGKLTIGGDYPVRQLEASTTQGSPILRFESIPLKKGDQLAASGGKSLDTLPIDGPGPHVPLFEITRGHGYIAGKLSVLQPITLIKSTVTVQALEVKFTSSFEAPMGYVLGATISDLDDDGASVLSQYIVIH